MGGEKSSTENTLNDLSGKEWLKFLRTWFTVQEEPGRALSEVLKRMVEVHSAALDAAAAQDGLDVAELRSWIEMAGSWTVVDSRRYAINRETELHPARYPEELVEKFVRFFTKARGTVLDPFAGSGATLVSCWENERYGVGIELSERYADLSNKRLRRLAQQGRQLTLDVEEGASAAPPPGVVLQGNAKGANDPTFWSPHRESLQNSGVAFDCDGIPQFDFVMTSPPYWDMLRQSRGGVKSAHKRRGDSKLDTHYSDVVEDLGNIESYDEFVSALGSVFEGVVRSLRPGGYMVVVVQNMRSPDGEIVTLAWDLARVLNTFIRFQGEKLWCQNTKFLGIWGYPKIFVPNYHHHYCLIFRKPIQSP